MSAIDQVSIRARLQNRSRFMGVSLLVIILVFAFVIRILFMWPIVIDDRNFGGSDDLDYHKFAISLVEHGLLGKDGQPSAYRMPLFPLFLAAIYRVAGPDRIIAQAVIMMLSVVNVALAYVIGRQLGNQRAGLIAAIIAALDVDQINFAGQLMTETLCTLLVTLSMVALVVLRRRGGWRWTLGVGILLSLTILVRVNILLIVPVACAWIFRYGVGSIRNRVASIIIIATLCGGAWGGWVVRNYITFGAFIPLTTQGGSGYYGIYNDEAAAPQPIEHFGEWRNLALSEEIQQASEVEKDRIQRQLAIAWIQAHPFKAVQVALVQVYHFWHEYLNPLYLSTLLLAIGGLGLLIRRGNPDGLLWLLVFGTLTIVAFFTLAVPRFHAPLLPGIAALAGIALGQIWVRIAPYLPRAGS